MRPDMKIVDVHYVFDRKCGTDGNNIRHKLRLVAEGSRLVRSLPDIERLWNRHLDTKMHERQYTPSTAVLCLREDNAKWRRNRGMHPERLCGQHNW
eukprot:scaffold125882_cov47-Prasinocladus_malaysianus.AAC.2